MAKAQQKTPAPRRGRAKPDPLDRTKAPADQAPKQEADPPVTSPVTSPASSPEASPAIDPEKLDENDLEAARWADADRGLHGGERMTAEFLAELLAKAPNAAGNGAVLDLKNETLSGDMRDAILYEVHKLAAWHTTPAEGQHAFNVALEQKCQDVITQAVRLVLQYDFPAVPIDLHKMNFDKAIDIKCSATFEPENVLALSRQLHRRAVMLLVDPAEFFGERSPAPVEPDQKDAFAAGS